MAAAQDTAAASSVQTEREIEQLINEMPAALDRLRATHVDIGRQLDQHIILLDQLDNDMDEAQAGLSKANRLINNILHPHGRATCCNKWMALALVVGFALLMLSLVVFA